MKKLMEQIELLEARADLADIQGRTDDYKTLKARVAILWQEYHIRKGDLK